jgi:phosphatidate cytidylyltransferase
MTRELSAAAGIAAVLLLLFVAPAWTFGLAAGALGLLTLAEFLGLAGKAGIPVPRFLVLAVATVMFGEAAFPVVSKSGLAVGGALFAAAVLFSFAALVSDVPVADALAAVSAPCAGMLLIVLPVCGLIWLAHVELSGAGAKFGPRLILFLLVTIWGCDSAAYYVGRRFGKRKLAPAVSPGKTIEGTIGGFLGSLAVSIAASALFLKEFRPAEAALVGGLASSAGQIGDLVESMFKRAAGVKDSGRFLPGHGGFYDRLDSVLFAVPVVCAAVLVKMLA